MLLAALTRDFDASGRVLAGPFSTAVACFALSVVAAGRAVDHDGPRRTSALAGVLSGTGLTVTALAQHLIVLHVGFGLLFGMGSGLAYSSVVTWASTRTDTGAPGPVGLVVAAYAAGPVVAGPVVGLGTAAWGWRATVLLGASVVAVVTVLASRLLPDATVGTGPTSGPTAQRTARRRRRRCGCCSCPRASPGCSPSPTPPSWPRSKSSTSGSAVWPSPRWAWATSSVASPATRSSPASACARALRIDLVLLCVALVALTSLSGQAAALLSLVLLAVQYGALSALLPSAVRRVCDASRFDSTYGWVFSAWGLAGVLAPRLHDPAATDGAGRGPWAVLTVAAIASLGMFERLSTQHRP